MWFVIFILAFVQLAAVWVVFGALAIKFASLPFSFVPLAAVCIVKGALAMIVAIHPLAFVRLAAVCPVVGAEAMFVTVFDLAFKLVAIVIVFDDIIWHLLLDRSGWQDFRSGGDLVPEWQSRNLGCCWPEFWIILKQQND